MSERPTKPSRRVESFLKLGDEIVPGDVKIDLEACSGCGLCALACPAGALELVDQAPRVVKPLPFCIACGDCVAICPDEAIELVRFLEFRCKHRFLNRGEPSRPRKF